MRVLCRHGHFAFYPRYAGEIADFVRYYDTELVREEDYYTFPGLKGLKRYSIKGKIYGTLPALTTYEGRYPWQVMKENGFVYHMSLDMLVPKLGVVGLVDPPLTGDYFVQFGPNPLIQPGVRNSIGMPILSYEGEYMNSNFQLRISGLEYE